MNSRLKIEKKEINKNENQEDDDKKSNDDDSDDDDKSALYPFFLLPSKRKE